MKLLRTIVVLQVFFNSICHSQEETHITVQVQFLSETNTPKNLPLVIANGNDTLQLDRRYNNYSEYNKGYVFEYSGEYDTEKKASFKIHHPDFPILRVDSVNLSTDIRLNMLNEHEEFYVSNGIKTSLNFQRKYTVIKFEGGSNVDSLLKTLNAKYNLLIAADFRDSIRIKKADKNLTYSKEGYGGIEDILIYTFWLKKEGETPFQNRDSMYNEIRNIPKVAYMGVPQSFSENLTNGFIIHLKKEIDSKEIDKLISKYSLIKDQFYDTYLKYHSNEHHFVSNDLLPNNLIMIELMKENIVKTVVIKEMSYETY
ncbi:MAG: hypothetical protein HRT68_09845 [Flavobacteriaceae bacterium]|nr:hypothetical protein [Flavobacteriaceae bacterium]